MDLRIFDKESRRSALQEAEQEGRYDPAFVWDLRCPVCAGNCDIRVGFAGQLCLLPEGSEDIGDHEWDSESEVRCGDCDFQAKARDFEFDRTTESWLPPLTTADLLDQAKARMRAAQAEVADLSIQLLEEENTAAKGQRYQVEITEEITTTWVQDVVADSPLDAGQAAYDFFVVRGNWSIDSVVDSVDERHVSVDEVYVGSGDVWEDEYEPS